MSSSKSSIKRSLEIELISRMNDVLPEIEPGTFYSLKGLVGKRFLKSLPDDSREFVDGIFEDLVTKGKLPFNEWSIDINGRHKELYSLEEKDPGNLFCLFTEPALAKGNAYWLEQLYQ